MKRYQHPESAPREVSRGLQQRINMYALAASAAGMGIIGPAMPAAAKIVYTPANLKFVNQSFAIDLNHDGKSDIQFQYRYGTDHYLSVNGAEKGNGVVAGGQQMIRGVARAVAAALPKGAVIGGSRKFPGAPQVMGAVYYNSDGGQTYFYGKFANAGTVYVGLRFKIHGKTHYGWARVKITIPFGSGNLEYPPITAQLSGYAYETIAGKKIFAGTTKGPDEVTMQTASLGKLALGASALPSGRSKIAAK